MSNHNISLYKERLGLRDAIFSLIAHDDSIVAIVYKIKTTDGNDLILKICDQSQHYYKELYFLKKFADRLPVPRIIDIVNPESVLHGALLMECLPGEVLTKKNLTTELAYEIGTLLAKIHLNRTDAFGDLTKEKSMVQDPRRYFADKFDESFSECIGHLPDSILWKCSDYYKENLERLSSVDGPCIIHRDFRPGNILVNEGRVSGVIDWASGRSGFAEDDLCPLEIGEWGNDPAIKKSFLDGYATVRSVPDYAAVMPLLLLNRTIAAVGFTVKIGTWSNRDSELYQRNRKIIEQILN